MKTHDVFLYTGVLCASLIAATVGASSMRKELPYEFDIVPIHQGVGITNTASWNQRDLIVSAGEVGGTFQSSVLMKGGVNQCVVEGLKGAQTYSLQIKRADLKGRLLYKPFETEVTVLVPAPKYVVLVGASVGREWNLSSFPVRTGEYGYSFGYRGKYSYDKEDLLQPLLTARLKPDIVIIKECAAYFPENLDNIIDKLPHWVDLLKTNGITPVLATCAPVTEDNDKKHPGRQDAIEKFNESVRSYAEENRLGLLDLARVLRNSENNQHLREDYALPDGLHLAPKGYEALDKILIQSIVPI